MALIAALGFTGWRVYTWRGLQVSDFNAKTTVAAKKLSAMAMDDTAMQLPMVKELLVENPKLKVIQIYSYEELHLSVAAPDFPELDGQLLLHSDVLRNPFRRVRYAQVTRPLSVPGIPGLEAAFIGEVLGLRELQSLIRDLLFAVIILLVLTLIMLALTARRSRERRRVEDLEDISEFPIEEEQDFSFPENPQAVEENFIRSTESEDADQNFSLPEEEEDRDLTSHGSFDTEESFTFSEDLENEDEDFTFTEDVKRPSRKRVNEEYLLTEEPEDSDDEFFLTEEPQDSDDAEKFQDDEDFSSTEDFQDTEVMSFLEEDGDDRLEEEDLEVMTQEILSGDAPEGSGALENSLGQELENATSSNQDLALILFADESAPDVLKEKIRETYTQEHLCFPWKEEGMAVIEPNKDLDTCLAEVNEFVKNCIAQTHTRSLRAGLSSRNGRLLNASRMLKEVLGALHKTSEEKTIVAFRSDPEKYRRFLKEQDN